MIMSSGLKKYDIDPADLDTDGICENQTTGGAANLVLNGALCDLGTALQFDIADAYSSGVGGIRLLFDSAGDISTVVFTITGKDQDGIAVTETVTGVTTTAVSTVNFYSQVTQIAASAAVGSNVFVGTATGELVSRTVPLNRHSDSAAAVAVSGLSGTCQFDLQQTFDDFLQDSGTINWFDISSDQAADVAATATLHATGVRCKFDSYTNGAELQFHVSYNPYR
jgi:hypothetical protein